MLSPAIPEDEAKRIAALRSLNVLFTPAEGRFDRITRLASRLLGTPIALVSLVGESCQWFKSSQGLDATETTRCVSFCGHAILSDEVLVVENALLDERFADNPLVTGDPQIRFYAGHPLHAPDRSRIGTLCLIDRVPRSLSIEQRKLLGDLAHFAEEELQRFALNDSQRTLLDSADDLQRRTLLDPRTRVWNRAAIERLLDAEMQSAPHSRNIQIVVIGLDNLAEIGALHGSGACDAALAEFAQRIRRIARSGDSIGYLGDGTFLVVMADCDLEFAVRVSREIRKFAIQEAFVTAAALILPVVHVGVTSTDSVLRLPGQTLAATVVASACAARISCVPSLAGGS